MQMTLLIYWKWIVLKLRRTLKKFNTTQNFWENLTNPASLGCRETMQSSENVHRPTTCVHYFSLWVVWFATRDDNCVKESVSCNAKITEGKRRQNFAIWEHCLTCHFSFSNNWPQRNKSFHLLEDADFNEASAPALQKTVLPEKGLDKNVQLFVIKTLSMVTYNKRASFGAATKPFKVCLKASQLACTCVWWAVC